MNKNKETSSKLASTVVQEDALASALDKEDEIAAMAGAMMSGMVLQDFLNMSDKHLEKIYAIGYKEFISEKYNSSQDIFRFLCILNPTRKDYWLGLAKSMQLQQKHKDAIQAYGAAALLDVYDAQTSLSAGVCMLEHGDKQGGQQALAGCMQIAKMDHTQKNKEAAHLAEKILERIDEMSAA